MNLKSIIQEEPTGCGIAAVANILGKSYADIKSVANGMRIYAEDESLWSETEYVRKLLASAGVNCSPTETPFESWQQLPDLALLAIKLHQKDGQNFWHWVVFKRANGEPVVLDSASYLPANIRTDFSDMQPKWFIPVVKHPLLPTDNRK